MQHLHTEPVWKAPSNVTRMDPLSQPLRHQKTQGKVTIKDKTLCQRKDGNPHLALNVCTCMCIYINVYIYLYTMEHIHSHWTIQCFCIFIKLWSHHDTQFWNTSSTSKTNTLPVALLFFVHPPTLGKTNLLSVSIGAHLGHFRSDVTRNGLKWLPSCNVTQARANHIVAGNTSLIPVAKYLTIWTDMFSQSEARQFCSLSYTFPD